MTYKHRHDHVDAIINGALGRPLYNKYGISLIAKVTEEMYADVGKACSVEIQALIETLGIESTVMLLEGMNLSSFINTVNKEVLINKIREVGKGVL